VRGHGGLGAAHDADSDASLVSTTLRVVCVRVVCHDIVVQARHVFRVEVSVKRLTNVLHGKVVVEAVVFTTDAWSGPG
jgi:hypothetical protein